MTLLGTALEQYQISDRYVELLSERFRQFLELGGVVLRPV